jgi:dGTPase
MEAQVMDFADDVAYSVHDYEDAIVEGFIKLDEISDAQHRKQLINDMLEWAGSSQTATELDDALSRLQKLDEWLVSFDGSDRAHGDLKNLTSALIGSFVSRTVDATFESHTGLLTRYRADLIVPAEVKSEIAVLKGLVSSFLMSHESRREYYERQRELLTELADLLLAANGTELDSYCRLAWSKASNETERYRVIVDQVACLTDQGAINLHKRLKGSAD